jgi:hypothetical protein
MKINLWLDCRRFYGNDTEKEKSIIDFDEWQNKDLDRKFLYSDLSKVVNFTDLVKEMLELGGLKDSVENDIGENIEIPLSVNRIIEGKTNEKYKKNYLEFEKSIRPYIEFDHSFGKGPVKRPLEKQEWETETNLKKAIGPLKVDGMTKKEFDKGLYGDGTSIRMEYPTLRSATTGGNNWTRLSQIWGGNPSKGARNSLVTEGYRNEQSSDMPNTIRTSFKEKELVSIKAKSRAILQIRGLQMRFKIWNCNNKEDPEFFDVPVSYIAGFGGETDGSAHSIYYDLGEFFYTMYFIPQFNLNTGTQATATATVTEGKITSVQITEQGAGYDNTKPPNITISDTTGTGAVLFPTISADGKFTSIVPVPNFNDDGDPIGPKGDGYSNDVTITIDPPPQLKSYLLYQQVPFGTNRFIYRLQGDLDDNAIRTLFNGLELANSFYWIPDKYPALIDIDDVENDIKMNIANIIKDYYYNKEHLILFIKNFSGQYNTENDVMNNIIDSGEDIHICLDQISFDVEEKTDLINEGNIQVSNSLEDIPGVSLITINYIKDALQREKPSENNIDLDYDELVRKKLVINRLLQKTYTGGKP